LNVKPLSLEKERRLTNVNVCPLDYITLLLIGCIENSIAQCLGNSEIEFSLLSLEKKRRLTNVNVCPLV